MHIALGTQLGRNVEAYVDDIVVKSREARTLIKDLEEMFASLCKVDLRLNPEKCVFGVPSGSYWVSWCHTGGSRPTWRRSRP